MGIRMSGLSSGLDTEAIVSPDVSTELEEDKNRKIENET